MATTDELRRWLRSYPQDPHDRSSGPEAQLAQVAAALLEESRAARRVITEDERNPASPEAAIAWDRYTRARAVVEAWQLRCLTCGRPLRPLRVTDCPGCAVPTSGASAASA